MNDLHELYFAGKIDAKILGHLAWRLSHLGVEAATPYAVPPVTSYHNEQQSGKYQDKLDRAYDFRFNDSELYTLEAPMRSHLTGEREPGTVYMQPVHESLARELDSRPELVGEWESLVSQQWIPAYEHHPAIKGASLRERQRTFGIALYMDASQFQTRDGLLLMTCHLICSGNRHLVFALPKSTLCCCGCAGWCTLFQIYRAIYWSLEAAANGVKPLNRHDGTCLDEPRLGVAGKEVKWKFILIDVVGDWSEIVSRWAFTNWQATVPCYLCICTLEQLKDALHPVQAKDPNVYFAECSACEIWIFIDSWALRTSIRFALLDDSTRKGRVLKTTCPLILKAGLKLYDRLEPSPQLSDVYDFEKKTVPFLALFWRTPAKAELTVHHRHPLISRVLGTNLWTLCTDTLHGLDLGVYPAWSTRVLHLCFEADIYETRASRISDHMKANALAIMRDLRIWYPGHERGFSEGAVTRIQMIEASQLGNIAETATASFIDFKGQENRHFQPFVLHLLRRHEHILKEFHPTINWMALEAAGQALVDLREVMAREPRKMSDEGYAELNRCMKDHITYASLGGVHMLPKHHMDVSILLCTVGNSTAHAVRLHFTTTKKNPQGRSKIHHKKYKSSPSQYQFQKAAPKSPKVENKSEEPTWFNTCVSWHGIKAIHDTIAHTGTSPSTKSSLKSRAQRREQPCSEDFLASLRDGLPTIRHQLLHGFDV